jgi:hypothetical protein
VVRRCVVRIGRSVYFLIGGYLLRPLLYCRATKAILQCWTALVCNEYPHRGLYVPAMGVTEHIIANT